jgi:hypothetical protein
MSVKEGGKVFQKYLAWKFNDRKVGHSQGLNSWLQESGTPHVIHRRQPIRPLHHRGLLCIRANFIIIPLKHLGHLALVKNLKV